MAASQQPDRTGSDAQGRQIPKSTQSDNQLSQTPSEGDEDGRFSVAEEMNFDAQSDEARRVGRMPQAAGAADAMAKSMSEKNAAPAEPDQPDTEHDEGIRQAVERAVPPSN